MKVRINNQKAKKTVKNDMLKWVKELFPLNRSITGQGIRASYSYLKKINPEFKTLKFKSGKKVFDWTVPEEWEINNAYIEHLKTGKKFAEFKKNNLHLVGYSIRKNFITTKKKLKKKIYSLIDQPNSIPYVTSYYKKDWGFCLSENDKNKLPRGKYRVFIDSNFKKGSLDLIELVLPGKTKKEIFFSTYFCHPSMANNELSGPVIISKIVKFLKKRKNNFTYRFVILPETIGSISYLSRKLNILKKRMIAGFVVTCAGDELTYSLTESRTGKNISDYLVKKFLSNKRNFKVYSYLDRISDERQYCSPSVDLPVSTFSKSRDYKEYHTNKDNLNFISKKGLNQSFLLLKNIIGFVEKDLYENRNILFPKSNVKGEPFLTKRNLYKTLSMKTNYKKKDRTADILDILSYCDGKSNILHLEKILNIPLKQLTKYLIYLKKINLITF